VARRRFFVGPVEEGRAHLRGEEAHHLTRVLRAEAGQQYEISDGRRVYLAQIEEAGKSAVSFRVLEILEEQRPLPPLTLYMALIKFDRFEWVVEKATELGATAIVPVECARSEAGLLAASVKRSDRWRKIARESGQQARRVTVPEIGNAVRVGSVSPVGLGCRLEEQAGAGLLIEVLKGGAGVQGVSLLVGPEGGWTDTERVALNGAGWLPASLGPMVLRAETAAIAALAIAGQLPALVTTT
jgi:16S rRNA (uracil1498-N3)-methyltransferase